MPRKPRKRNINILTDDAIASIVYNDICWAVDFRRAYEDKWQRLYKLYKNYIDKATYPFSTNLAIPTAYTIIGVQRAFLLDMIFESGAFVEVAGKTPEGQAQASAVNDLLDYHFRNSFKTYEDWGQFIDQLLIYGTSIYKVFWDVKPAWKTEAVIKYNENGSPIGYEKVNSPRILGSQPNGYTVDLYQFGVDPNATCLDDARFAFEDMWLDPIKLRELEQMDIGFKNIDEAIRIANNTNRGLADRLQEINMPHFQAPPEYTSTVRGKVHLIDYWGYMVKGWNDGEIKKNAMQQLYHVIMALPGNVDRGFEGAGTVVFAEPSPFFHNKLPYVDARINAAIGEFYGTGDLEYCESLLLEQRDVRNVQQDNLVMTINKMFKVRKAAGVDPNELIWRPGGVVYVSNPDDVTIMESAPVPFECFRAQDDIRRDIEQVTGVNDFTVGQFRSATGFNDTATGVSLIQQVALKRIGHKGQIIQRAIRDTAEMVFSLVGQYEPWGTSVRVLDRNAATKIRFLDISPEALRQMYDFNIVSAPSLGSKPVRTSQLIQLLQILIQAKQIDQNFSFDMNAFVRRIIDEMDVPNSQEFFGFEQYMQALPESLGEPANPEEMLPPEEENRLLAQGQFIIPKLGENHPQHMIVHYEAYKNMQGNDSGRILIEKHYNAHVKLKDQTKEAMAQIIGQQSAMTAITGTEGYMAAKNQRNKNYLTGGTTRSKGSAQGQEGLTRGMGNMLGGNA